MSLVVWYPLIRDLKNQGLDDNDLSQSSTAVTYTGGLYGYSATFTQGSSQYLYRPKINQNKNITIAGWFKATQFNGQMIFFNCSNGQGTKGWSVWSGHPSKTLYYQFGDVKWNYSGHAMEVDKWFHLAMVIDNESKYYFYLNGELLATGTVTTLPDYSDGNDISIGIRRCNAAIDQPLYGQAQDFRIYDHALSTKEIKELAKGLILHHDLKGYGAGENILPLNSLYHSSIEEEGYRGQTVFIRDTTATTESYLGWGRTGVVEQSTQYTFSCYLWINDNVKGVDFFWLSDTEENPKTGGGWVNVTYTYNIQGIIPNQWNYMTWTFTTKADDYTGFIRIDNNGSKTEGEHAILKACCPKLEKGSKATPYISHDLTSTDIEEDLSGNGYNGTRQGVTFAPDSPRYYMSTEFDADKDLILDRIYHSGDEVSNLSISIWAKFTSGLGSNNNLWNLNENAFWRIRPYTASQIQNIVYMNSGFQDVRISLTNELSLNTWYNIVMTFDNGIFKCYLNGELVGTADKTSISTTVKCSNNTSRWSLGDFEYNQEKFIGNLSDFRIYAKTLTADDVKELYNVSAQVDKSGKLYCGELVEE